MKGGEKGKTRIKKRRDKKKAEKQQKKDRMIGGGGRKQTGTLYTPGIYLTCSKSL